MGVGTSTFTDSVLSLFTDFSCKHASTRKIAPTDEGRKNPKQSEAKTNENQSAHLNADCFGFWLGSSVHSDKKRCHQLVQKILPWKVVQNFHGRQSSEYQ
jgi:hypothetical protein